MDPTQEIPLALQLIDRYGLPLVLVVGLLFWLVPKLNQLWDRSFGRPKYDVADYLANDAEVNALLREVMVTLDAHRAILSQYHNGAYSLVGIPFLKLSATHEAVAPSHSAHAHLYQNLSTSLFADNITDLLKRDVVCLSRTDTHCNSALRSVMTVTGTQVKYQTGIRDSAGQMVGVLMISYDEPHELLPGEEKVFVEFAQRAAILLELMARAKPRHKEAHDEK